MALRDILKIPDKRLRLVSEPVKRVDASVRALADDMPIQNVWRPMRPWNPLKRYAQSIDPTAGQSRSNSLMLVLARVFSSTRLTMTAQERLGLGSPLARGLPGSVPGTTTA